jgi:hypothetical protein
METWAYILWGIAVAAFGAGVGASELVARYRDAPFQALRTSAALWYVLVNCIAALFAYVIIVKFDWSFGADAGRKEWVQALVAGFGSMVFFRSSLFTMKVGDTDVSVGPAIFFQVLLFATDRACDRERAEPRSTLVSSIMQGVSFEQAREALPSFCFELMQNVPASEQQQFRQVVDALAASKMRDSVKVLNLGLMLMNVVGSQVLTAAVRSLGEKIQGPAKLELDVFTGLQKVDFSKAYPLLIDVCFIMSMYGSRAEQEDAKKAVIAEISQLRDDATIENSTKVTILGLALQKRVGDAVLLAALAHVAEGIQLPLAEPAADTAGEAAPPESATAESGGAVVHLRQDAGLGNVGAETGIAAGGAVDAPVPQGDQKGKKA